MVTRSPKKSCGYSTGNTLLMSKSDRQHHDGFPHLYPILWVVWSPEKSCGYHYAAETDEIQFPHVGRDLDGRKHHVSTWSRRNLNGNFMLVMITATGNFIMVTGIWTETSCRSSSRELHNLKSDTVILLMTTAEVYYNNWKSKTTRKLGSTTSLAFLLFDKTISVEFSQPSLVRGVVGGKVFLEVFSI